MEIIYRLLKICVLMVGIFGLFMLTWGFIEKSKYYRAIWSVVIGIGFTGVMIAWIY